jgi:hypothetical protein
MTLIEVMIALLVATVGLLGALAMLSTLLSGSSFSRHLTEASVIGQSRIEELQMLVGVTAVPANPPDTSLGCDPDPMAVGCVPVEDPPAGYANGTLLDGTGKPAAATAGGLFQRYVAWGSQVGGGAQLRLMRVDVRWTDSFGRLHQITSLGSRIP